MGRAGKAELKAAREQTAKTLKWRFKAVGDEALAKSGNEQ